MTKVGNVRKVKTNKWWKVRIWCKTWKFDYALCESLRQPVNMAFSEQAEEATQVRMGNVTIVRMGQKIEYEHRKDYS